MKNKYLLSTIVLLFIIINSCKQDSGNFTTKLGNTFNFCVNKPGPTAKSMESLFCYGQRWVDDSLISSTEFKSRYLVFTLPELSTITKEYKVMDVLSYVSVGDSITADQEMDSLTMFSFPNAKKKSMHMNLRIDSIGSPGSSEAYSSLMFNGNPPLLAQRAVDKNRVNALLSGFIDSFLAGKETMTELDSGILYKVIEEGENSVIGKSTWVVFEVVSHLRERSILINSYGNPNGEYILTNGNQTNRGLDRVIQILRRGSKAFIYLPYQMAYGEDGGGVVPPKTDLFFYVEVKKVFPAQLARYKEYFGMK